MWFKKYEIKWVTDNSNALKEKNTNYMKVFGWKEHHVCWSFQIRQNAVDYLLEHLLQIARYSALKNKQKTEDKTIY